MDQGLVYYVLDADRFGQRVKIGKTRALSRRLRDLRVQTVTHCEPIVLALEPGYTKLEQTRHEQYADCRLGGEWFEYIEPLREHILTLGNPVGLIRDNADLWQFARGWAGTPDVDIPEERVVVVTASGEAKDIQF